MLLLFLAICGLSFGSELIANPCPLVETSFQCVGEGDDCHGDVRSTPYPNTNVPSGCTAGLPCRICADDSLVCTNRQCVKRTRGVSQSCNPAAHTHCLSNLECSGTCYDPANTRPNPGYFGQVGEACDYYGSSDCYSNLNCNQFTLLCEPTSTVCASSLDCPAFKYCAASTASSDSQRYCLDIIPLGQRAGAMCSMLASQPCGWTYGCTPLHQALPPKDDSRAICLAYYSIALGHPCTNNIYCASGYCKTAPGGAKFCASFDYASMGDACGPTSGECGGDTSCKCPKRGGARMRCSKSDAAILLEQTKAEYFNQKGYLECLESNGCQSQDPRMGSCGYKNCRDKLGSLTLVGSAAPYQSQSDITTIHIEAYLNMHPERQCGKYWESGIAEYKGWEGIKDSAGAIQASFFLVGATIAFLLSMF